MEEVTDTKLYEYTTEVIIEVMGMDERGDFAIASYQFAFDNEKGTVRVKGEVETLHEPHVEKTLEEAGYSFKQPE